METVTADDRELASTAVEVAALAATEAIDPVFPAPATTPRFHRPRPDREAAVATAREAEPAKLAVQRAAGRVVIPNAALPAAASVATRADTRAAVCGAIADTRDPETARRNIFFFFFFFLMEW